MGNEWIEWKGGHCPVPAGTLVDVRHVNGAEHFAAEALLSTSQAKYWAAGIGPGAIIAYRLHEPPHAAASDKQVAGTHYKDMGVEPRDVVDTWSIEQRIGAYRHGALKYLMRMGSKDESAQEIAEGIHYMEKLLEVLKADAQ